MRGPESFGLWAWRSPHCFLAIRRKQGGSAAVAEERECALQFRLLLTATPAARLRWRGNDVGNARVVHLFIQCRKVLIRDFLDLRRSIIDQRRQFRELFFLVPAGGGHKAVQIIEKLLTLIW